MTEHSVLTMLNETIQSLNLIFIELLVIRCLTSNPYKLSHYQAVAVPGLACLTNPNYSLNYQLCSPRLNADVLDYNSGQLV